MRITVKNFKETPTSCMRRCGYFPDGADERTGELRFIRSMGGGDFPRFHIYSKKSERGETIINLHLDQKRPSYGGSAAHGGEYEGELVEREANRIKSCVSLPGETEKDRENLDKFIGF